MRPRIVLTLVGAAALLVAAGVAVRVASADKPSEFTAEYTQTAVWDGGLIGSFTVSNPSNRLASDWNISFSLPDDTRLAGVWNGELFPSDATYVIKPTRQTRTVGAHRSVTVGLTAVVGHPVVPSKCTINGKTCKVAVTTAGLASAPVGATDQFGAATPDASAGSTSDRSAGARDALGRAKPGARQVAKPATPSPTTSFVPSVNVTNANRPTLSTIAEVSGARTLTLVSALPAAAGRCDLKWGGAVEPKAYAKEIADALNSDIGLIASIGATNGMDLAHACGSVAALQTQVKKILDLGLRSVDFTIGEASLADSAANARLAQLVVRLKAEYPGLTISYTLPAAVSGGSLATAESIARPLVTAKNAGAVVDRVNILPVDVAAPLDVLKPLLGRVRTADMVDSLLAAATGVHEQIMKIQGVDAATAWRMLGIIPVIGGGDLVDKSSQLVGSVGRLADFAKSKGLGLVGFLPLNTGQTCLGGIVGQLLSLPAVPLLSCVDSTALAGFFTITDSFNRALR
jgi:chitinase